VAVEVGLVLACVFFIYRMSTLFKVQPLPAGPLPPAAQAFELFGSLFFGAVGKIEALPAQLPPGTTAVVLDMHRLISMDTSGLDALSHLHRDLARQGVQLRLCALNEQPQGLIHRAGFDAVLGADRIHADLRSAADALAAEASPTAGGTPLPA
jgi:SulP family sulfate permease